MAKRMPAEPQDELYGQYTKVRGGLGTLTDAWDDAELRVRSDIGKFNDECNQTDILLRTYRNELRGAEAELDTLMLQTELALVRVGVPYEAPGAILTDALAQVGLRHLQDVAEAEELPTGQEEAVQEAATVSFDAPTIETPLGRAQLRRMDKR